ncbi:hypothetical protein [Sinosporangium siamense]|uniref:Gram-positive cocci surface proteins LPxTG domain-containing protein n=1 Tax=Sinosporangium siamense TaxID=1367973 RepID=A0A919RDH0_9ACTN|nr:hypothetical protein [Sinosporangium siamense]GII91422.1 hypothetical protein Ssi02_16530 [Sinosporangium siamense]
MSSTSAPPFTWASGATLGAAAIAVLSTLIGLGPVHADGDSSDATAVRLHMEGVPALPQPGFDGTWGAVATGAGGGVTTADLSVDPDNVRSLVSIAATNTTTMGDPATSRWSAENTHNVTSVRLKPGGPDLISVASLHTSARCAPPGASTVQAAVNVPMVANVLIGDGESSIPVTGSQIGYPSVATGTPTATLNRFQEAATPLTASARTTISVAGRLLNVEGRVVHDGPLVSVSLGDARATCGTEPSPSPTPTPPAPTPEPPHIRTPNPIPSKHRPSHHECRDDRDDDCGTGHVDEEDKVHTYSAGRVYGPYDLHGPELPFTGAQIGVTGAFGVAALGLGAAALYGGSRRKRRSAPSANPSASATSEPDR